LWLVEKVMRITRGKAVIIRTFVFGAALVCLGAGTQATAARTSECSPLSGSPVRVRLTLAPEGLPLHENIIKSVAERAWSAEGLEVNWIQGTGPASWKDVDLWVLLRRSGPSLAAAHFEDGEPRKFVQLSIDSTIDRLKGRVSRKYQIQEASARHLLVASGLREIEESIGYAIAREISPCAAAR
jgi:hypothetical protein